MGWRKRVLEFAIGLPHGEADKEEKPDYEWGNDVGIRGRIDTGPNDAHEDGNCSNDEQDNA